MVWIRLLKRQLCGSWVVWLKWLGPWWQTMGIADPSEFLKLPRFEIPRVVVPVDQVHPQGSQWARNPIPSCFYCDQSKCGTLLPNLTEEISYAPGQYGGDDWAKQEACAQACSGFNLVQCLPG